MKDLRFGLRMLGRQPAFTAVAIVTLALGIGANTAIFTLFNAILLQSLPVRDPGRLVVFGNAVGEGTIAGDAPTGAWTLFSYDVYQFLRTEKLPFESIAAVRSGESPVAARIPGVTGPQAERARAHLVSGNYFDVMGVTAALGRTLTLDDDRPGALPVAVVSYGFWTDRLHGDPTVVGKTALVNGTAFTIAGVAPREFFGERVRRPPDFWVPLAFQPQIELRPSSIERTNMYWLTLIARLAPGAARAQAESAATTALRQMLTAREGATLTSDRERQIKQSRVELADGAAGISTLRYLYSEPLRVLLVVVALVLAIACANVGNLLLSRAAARQSELTMRMALGAGRARIVRQLLTESLLLAIGGAAAGVLLARWVGRVLIATIAPATPIDPSIDGRVLMFTIGVTLASAILFGLAPALAGARGDLVTAMKSGSRGTVGGGRGPGVARLLVVAQIAMSLVLLVGANLFARSLFNLEQQPLGFDPDHVLLARVNPRLAGYKPDNVADLYRRLLERLQRLPGVRRVTLARYSPLGGSRSINSGRVEGYAPKPNENVEFETQGVAPDYPETMGIPLVAGRAVGPQDGAGAPRVAMVNEAFVRRFVPAGNPIGRHFGIDDSNTDNIEIIGVLRDARFQDDRQPIQPAAFTAAAQDRTQFALDAEIALRTVGDPAALAGELRRAIAEVDANLPVNDPKTLQSQVSANYTSQRLAARLVAAFGLLALLLAAVGLYGVLTQSVVRRTNELGVRMALGAEGRQVIWMILRDTLVLLAIGVAVGVPVAFGAARLVASQLFQVDAAAPASFALGVLVLAVVTVVTGFFPARRASRVDPIVALRQL
jgi:predicted permease